MKHEHTDDESTFEALVERTFEVIIHGTIVRLERLFQILAVVLSSYVFVRIVLWALEGFGVSR